MHLQAATAAPAALLASPGPGECLGRPFAADAKIAGQGGFPFPCSGTFGRLCRPEGLRGLLRPCQRPFCGRACASSGTCSRYVPIQGLPGDSPLFAEAADFGLWLAHGGRRAGVSRGVILNGHPPSGRILEWVDAATTPAPSLEPGRSIDEPSEDHKRRPSISPAQSSPEMSEAPSGQFTLFVPDHGCAGLAASKTCDFAGSLTTFSCLVREFADSGVWRSAGLPSPELKCARMPGLDHVFRCEDANLRMSVETVAGTSFRPNRSGESPELVPKAADVDVDGSVDRHGSAITPNVA